MQAFELCFHFQALSLRHTSIFAPLSMFLQYTWAPALLCSRTAVDRWSAIQAIQPTLEVRPHRHPSLRHYEILHSLYGWPDFSEREMLWDVVIATASAGREVDSDEVILWYMLPSARS